MTTLDKPIELASVVISKAGRDKGEVFAVVELVDASYVKVADGETRTLAKPKLKKLKHLRLLGDTEPLSKIADKLADGKQVFDAELRSALKLYK